MAQATSHSAAKATCHWGMLRPARGNRQDTSWQTGLPKRIMHMFGNLYRSDCTSILILIHITQAMFLDTRLITIMGLQDLKPSPRQLQSPGAFHALGISPGPQPRRVMCSAPQPSMDLEPHIRCGDTAIPRATSHGVSHGVATMSAHIIGNMPSVYNHRFGRNTLRFRDRQLEHVMRPVRCQDFLFLLVFVGCSLFFDA